MILLSYSWKINPMPGQGSSVNQIRKGEKYIFLWNTSNCSRPCILLFFLVKRTSIFWCYIQMLYPLPFFWSLLYKECGSIEHCLELELQEQSSVFYFFCVCVCACVCYKRYIPKDPLKCCNSTGILHFILLNSVRCTWSR